jgi:hypothetical protein
LEPRVRLKRTYDTTFVQYKTGWFWWYLRRGGYDGESYRAHFNPLDYAAEEEAKRLLAKLKRQAREAVERKAFRITYEEITLDDPTPEASESSPIISEGRPGEQEAP